ncbi:SDR family oxidoreductase [Nocardioides aurantiacus]|uniref:Citronellol/citronellal dehydrogenase n=1 Tax=Nocardioides aurantiacus TaxID=86796 RepID=A0A3N2CY38_9ACTN|nr:NAD(P)-dependent oxidoreductase [Nocardioides aurantiacus]ROR92348.1 citronellol/citronellal dehydrogenase [Nocardioides aurantiacus]
MTSAPPSPTRTLRDRTIVMSGGSRGIGLAIALRAARDGANVVLLAKTGEPHPKLEGTVHTAAAEIEAAGGQALAVVGDVRDDADVEGAVAAAVERFGGIDVVVNNASAIDLSGTRELSMKKYDLMQDINARGTFLLSKTALPHLERSSGAHVLTLSPPLDLRPQWAGQYLGYTMAKYGMSLVTLGLAEELREAGVAANSLWPRTMIATAAVANLLGGDEAVAGSRTPEMVADAAYAVLTRDPRTCTGNFFIDDEVLAQEGITDLEGYRAVPGGEAPLREDLFLDPI